MLDWQTRALELQAHYQKFNVAGRILLTGHSHQAWPDVALQGQLQAFEDAALHVDDKWTKAFEQADLVRQAYLDWLEDSDGEIVLGPNTQELITRWLSALPLDKKTTLVTTDGEFHSMRRLLSRLNETSLNVITVASEPVASLTERIKAACSPDTAAVMLSAVQFHTGRIVPGLAPLAEALEQRAIPLLVDTYHAINAMPFTIRQHNLDQAFVIGGGYKYCQFGEGNCFLRVPKDCDWRPVITGWYAEFAELAQARSNQELSRVAYGTGRWAFEGSTYDPTSHYRAVQVADFFRTQALSPAQLRAISLAQLTCLREALNAFRWPGHLKLPTEPLSELGGFLIIETPLASQLVTKLRQQQIYCDSRGERLRLGPAPYVTESQLQVAAETLQKIVASL